MNSKRTLMTNEYLDKVAYMLQSVIDFCNDLKSEGTSWNNACKKHGFDPIKTRTLVTQSIWKCKGEVPLLEEAELDLYDNYERLYNAVFGMDAVGKFKLPHDYKESVQLMLDSITPEFADVIMHHFGIYKYENDQKPYKELAEIMGYTQNEVRSMEHKGLRECWSRENRELLKHGVEKYTLMKKQEEEKRVAEKERMEKEHTLLLEQLAKPRDDENPLRTIFKECDETPFEKLELRMSIRSYNAVLKSGCIKTVGDIIRCGPAGIRRIPHVGDTMAHDIMQAFDTYIMETYKIASDKLIERFDGGNDFTCL